MTKSYKHFDHKERTLIYWWRKENLSRREIARRVQHSPSSNQSRTATESLVWASVLPERGSNPL